jgi:Holliday junction resolvase-like predicted endonuclease
MPIYQTKEDTKKEHAVVRLLESKTPQRFLEIKSVTSPADWVSYRDGAGVTHLVEIKNRTNSMGAYPTYMIDKKKVDKLDRLSAELGLGGLVIVGFTDYVAIAKTADIIDKSTVGTGGRYDRNDTNDIDTVYYFPIEHFKAVGR